MSVFKVKLQNIQQGYLDRDPSTASMVAIGNPADPYLGSPFTESRQRTIYVAGPNRIYRKLFDGDTFSDSNYWKRFAFPNLPLESAFIEVVTDDGSVYSDDPEENTFPVVYGGDTAYTVAADDTFDDNYIDIVTDHGGPATFCQITNFGTASTQNIKIKLNGSSSAILTLQNGDTQVFNNKDLLITKLAFEGGTADTTIQVVLSVRSVSVS